jgi:hypothetical protein
MGIDVRSRKFGYLRDPLFLASVAIYFLNRYLVRPAVSPPSFFHSYLNDLICIPFWLPPTLLLERLLRVRRRDETPSPGEISLHLIVWCLAFEVIGPRLPIFAGSVADPLDILAYSTGALVAAALWWRPPWPVAAVRRCAWPRPGGGRPR